jgi:hypothetical protein
MRRLSSSRCPTTRTFFTFREKMFCTSNPTFKTRRNSSKTLSDFIGVSRYANVNLYNELAGLYLAFFYCIVSSKTHLKKLKISINLTKII